MIVRDVKEKLNKIINELNKFDDEDYCYMDLDDNSGGNYFTDIEEIKVSKDNFGDVVISNY